MIKLIITKTIKYSIVFDWKALQPSLLRQYVSSKH